MGAQEFTTVGIGNTAQEAFNDAVQNAYYDHGHQGYSGSIAEKESFVVVKCEDVSDDNVEAVMNKMIDNEFSDKWGPCGCIDLKRDNKYVFFGWASS